MGSIVVKKSLEKREEENHKAEGAIKILEETQKIERRKNEDLQKKPLASHLFWKKECKLPKVLWREIFLFLENKRDVVHCKRTFVSSICFFIWFE